MDIEKVALMADIQYAIINENIKISIFKLIMSSFIFEEFNKKISNNTKNDFVEKYFQVLGGYYSANKAELRYCFEALDILIETNTVILSDNYAHLNKKHSLNYCLTDVQRRMLIELAKITDDAFNGMVIENV